MNTTDTIKTRIVGDSGVDVTYLDGASFSTASLKIITSEKEYVDDASLNAEQMALDMLSYKGRSTTSCPNTSD